MGCKITTQLLTIEIPYRKKSTRVGSFQVDYLTMEQQDKKTRLQNYKYLIRRELLYSNIAC